LSLNVTSRHIPLKLADNYHQAVIRIVAQRAGHIDKQVRQVAEEWLLDRTSIEPPCGPPAHHVLDQMLHLGFGGMGGAGYGLLWGRSRDHQLVRGALFGAGEFVLAYFGIFPLLHVTRPPWDATAREAAAISWPTSPQRRAVTDPQTS
jgi:hypothetical protein